MIFRRKSQIAKKERERLYISPDVHSESQISRDKYKYPQANRKSSQTAKSHTPQVPQTAPNNRPTTPIAHIPTLLRVNRPANQSRRAKKHTNEPSRTRSTQSTRSPRTKHAHGPDYGEGEDVANRKSQKINTHRPIANRKQSQK